MQSDNTHRIFRAIQEKDLRQVIPFSTARVETQEVKKLCEHLNRMLDAVRENHLLLLREMQQIEKEINTQNIKGGKKT